MYKLLQKLFGQEKEKQNRRDPDFHQPIVEFSDYSYRNRTIANACRERENISADFTKEES